MKVAQNLTARKIYEQWLQFPFHGGGLAAACPLAGPTGLFAPCFSVEINRPEQQLCDELVSVRSSGDPRAAALMVSWRPEFRTWGIVSGAAAIAWPQAWYHLGAAKQALSRTEPESIHPPGAVFQRGGAERPPRHEKGPLFLVNF